MLIGGQLPLSSWRSGGAWIGNWRRAGRAIASLFETTSSGVGWAMLMVQQGQQNRSQTMLLTIQLAWRLMSLQLLQELLHSQLQQRELRRLVIVFLW